MKLRNEQSGAIAIFISMAVSLLLVTVTTYATRLSISEVRQSSQVEQSDRSYYAAEAGIEEALQRIDSNPDSKIEDLFPAYVVETGQNGDRAVLQDFDGSIPNQLIIREDTPNAGGGTESVGLLSWRNRRVYDADLAPTGVIVKDEPLQLDLGRLKTRDSLGNEAPLANYNQVQGLDFCWTPSRNNAILEWTVLHYPANDADNVTTNKSLITLGTGTVGAPSDSFQIRQRPGSGGYTRCNRFTINDTSRRYIIRVKPIFEGVGNASPVVQNQNVVSYQASINETYAPGSVFIDDGTVLIDVVGESGNNRRRIIAKKERNGRLLGIFDFLLYQGEANTPLCKLGVQQSDVIYDPNTCNVTSADNPAGPIPTPTADDPHRLENESFSGSQNYMQSYGPWDPFSQRDAKWMNENDNTFIFRNGVNIPGTYTRMRIRYFVYEGMNGLRFTIDGRTFNSPSTIGSYQYQTQTINLPNPINPGNHNISIQAINRSNPGRMWLDYIEFFN